MRQNTHIFTSPTINDVHILGKQLLAIESFEDQSILLIFTLKQWFDCEVEILWFTLSELNKVKLKKIVRELPRNYYSLLLDWIKDLPILKTLVLEVIEAKRQNSLNSVTLPLTNKKNNLAFIRFHRNGNRIFGKRELISIENVFVQVFFALMAKRESEQSANLTELTNVITSILDPNDLFEKVTQLIHQRLGYQYTHIFTTHPGRKKIIYQSGDGLIIKDKIPYESLSFDTDDPTGLVPWVARNAKSFLCNDVHSEPLYKKIPGFLPDVKSELAIPLIFNEEVLGILDIQSDLMAAFTSEDVHLLTALSRNIAIALRNANLYRSEQWRRRVADSVREVAGLLTTDTDLSRVLESILNELENSLPCDFASIWLLEDFENVKRDGHPGNLALSAVHLSDSNITRDNGQDHLTPDVIIQVCNEAEIENKWLLDALASNQPLIRSEITPFEPIGSILDFPEDYSAIASPLIAAGQSLGVLVLGHQTSGRYGYEAQMLTSTFSNYAAVAIQNTRLYSATHDQAWVSTVLLQVAEAAQTINDLQQLLETMARITPSLIGVSACVIYLWSEDFHTFSPEAAYGLENDQVNEMLNWIIHEGELSGFDTLRETQNLVIIPRNDDSETITRLYSLFPFDSGVLAIIPMLSHRNLLGAFLVDFKDVPDRDLDLSNSNLLNEKVSIIQGITHQTAIAVENIKLVESQKEEAYVSFALLQVAQAVVSLNSLDEILESIVRITPILVGVKRVVIYLWQENPELFSYKQSYGISRSEINNIPKSFSPEEYPLLGKVKESLCPTFTVYDRENENPSFWNLIPEDAILVDKSNSFNQVSFTQNNFKPGEESIDNEILTIQKSLLYAYPLIVKGDLLGVLLIQEVGTNPHSITPRIRARRQQITIGITQQAALAIQNEKLQQEVVERGRLERELQLAREIQQTFLPNFLPDVPGWELDVLWKPAREVGGDFYDAFLLSGNRLAIVIADVADKGIPAALFMTLARTLIRATAREEVSPSVVLETVNDLLVAETERGLFITAFYALVTPLTGQVIYANAGHNPPVLVRSKSQKLERFYTTGMALGVLEDIHIKETSVYMDPGDSVVLYTDGITEAFSLDGEMFGESRLLSILQEHLEGGEIQSAKILLELIDHSVHSFIEGNTISDDLTLVTVRRNN